MQIRLIQPATNRLVMSDIHKARDEFLQGFVVDIPPEPEVEITSPCIRILFDLAVGDFILPSVGGT